MQYLVPPKVFSWSHTLPQSHKAICPKLIVSGASFTHQNNLGTATNWPGYLYERCRLEQVVDYSFPQLGNRYIHDSIKFAFDEIPSNHWHEYFVIVMWNYPIQCIKTASIEPHENWPKLDAYYRPLNPQPTDVKAVANADLLMMVSLREWLDQNLIPYAFTSYANLFDAPTLLKQTPNFTYIGSHDAKLVKGEQWIPRAKENYLFDYTFFKGTFVDDGHHPDADTKLKWADEILLPELNKLALVQKL